MMQGEMPVTLTGMITREALEQLTRNHDAWRRECINLTASENRMSPAVRRALDSDLVQRYGDYTGRDISARRYFGNRWIEEIERTVADLASEVFGAKYVDLRAISGHVAGSAVIMGLTRPGDVVLEVGPELGAHRLATKLTSASLARLQVSYLPPDPSTYSIDIGKAQQMIERLGPRLVILGSSAFLFPHPVKELSSILRGTDCVLAYDASHVLGLIAGRRFQDPLAEGAQVVFGSTHKTLPGPQGGIILSNDDELMASIAQALYPALVTSHHVFRLPALGLCLLEMQLWGSWYADQTISNAQALGRALHLLGIEAFDRDGCFSQSHTVVVPTAKYGDAKQIAYRLEEANIIVTTTRLPPELGNEGLRIGTQELTRMGAREEEMEVLAMMLSNLITQRMTALETLPAVREFAAGFQHCRYTWNN